MAYSLLDNLHKLPDDEIIRLQKKLGIILRNPAEQERLRNSVYNVYSRMGDPVQYIKRKRGSENAVNSLLRLMDAFGSMHISLLENGEILELKENPYTIWPEKDVCMISEEAMDVFSEKFETLPSDYLFGYIRQLSVKEKKSWARWIGLDTGPHSSRIQNRILYRKLAQLRFYAENEKLNIPGEYLEDVFPDDPSRFAVAWYYRDVLSFYDSLMKMESENTNMTIKQKDILRFLKLGKIIIEKEKPEFGRRARNRLVFSRENHPEGRLSGLYKIEEPESQKESLFQ